MRNFDYARARDVAEAVRFGAGGDSPAVAYLAGGTELLNWMRLGIVAPDHVVDISRIAGVGGIEKRGDEIWIGALVTLAEIEASTLIRAEATALAEACFRAASPQIRNRATLGGNVLQKTRCSYFRSEAPLSWPCNKRSPGSGCAALKGHNERHAILGWTDECVATQPSDPIVSLACLDAQLHVIGPRGERVIAARDFHLTQEEASRGSGDRARGATVETRLAPGELIRSIRVPIGRGQRSTYVKVRERESYEYAMVSAAAAITVEGGKISKLSASLGSVAQRPWRLTFAEKTLIGQALDKGAITDAVRQDLQAARSLSENAFKIQLAINTAVRAIQVAGMKA